MILLVVRDGGLDLEWVLDLSIPQLNVLVQSVTRLKYLDKTEDAWTGLVAGQMWKDPKKAMKDHVKGWEPMTRRASEKKYGDNDIGRAIQRFGGGF